MVYTLYGFLKAWDYWPRVLQGTYEGTIVKKSSITDIPLDDFYTGKASFRVTPQDIDNERAVVMESIASRLFRQYVTSRI